MTRQLHLNAIYSAAGGSLGGWRHADAPARAGVDFPFIAAQARKLEAAAFDAIFIADLLAVPDSSHPRVIEKVATVNDSLEPLTLLAALAAVTDRIGLVGTASTTYNHPYALARAFASLDHLSRGRAGWNVVTSLIDAEARNYGVPAHLDHADRYRRADEFLDVVYGLWDSFDDDAFVWDAAGGRVFHEHALHRLDHVGEFFRVTGPLNIARPPQGRPVIAQAGASPAGRDVAGRHGELIFSGASRLEEAVGYADDLRRRAQAAGRSSHDILLFPALSPIVASTRAEAEDSFASIAELLHPRVALGDLEYWLGGVDLTAYDYDGPLPRFAQTNQSHSTQERIYETARRENLTIRQFVERRLRAEQTVVGTPTEVADHIHEWFEAGAADGFNVSFPALPGTLDSFVELVVPELRRRGLFRERYTGTTLREHLGLSRPVSGRRRVSAEAV
ncbi:NtaA/DmoA family FMN-dependent monooxygenase [Microbacterium sp. SORGH_AS_0862]|uniref:NtaA/DmoA family FMN-dependent monooxygenase n=1 Tax=Microbacterium sp. SORGH_AS_0862 TaxID=3041789 RepID=UPI0027908E71|nr:NtaA/DmoA family FMN-dependent monooxygenase [Microbacterium sp. SORGH_AS_0862]MDQ1205720.1 FMN-dependent oxidoreductase (nitrilotriacetate monooxygenase family) [Microbacterium sp. SORGH_AS_0862]